MKVKRRKKSKKLIGKGMGGHGHGARKKAKGSGHRGGKGMSGSGKRADHRKTLVTKVYGSGYFGKKGKTSIGTKRDTRKRINIRDLILNLDSYAKKTKDGFEIRLEDYKILGTGEATKKLIIYAKEASKSAIEKIENAGGKIILKSNKAEQKESSESDESSD